MEGKKQSEVENVKENSTDGLSRRLPSNDCIQCEVFIPQEGPGTDFMMCSRCDEKICLPCASIPQDLFEVLRKNPTCRLNITSSVCIKTDVHIKDLGEKIDNMSAENDTRFNDMENKIVNIVTKSLRVDLTKEMQEKLKPQIVSEVKSDIKPEIISEVKKSIQQDVKKSNTKWDW